MNKTWIQLLLPPPPPSHVPKVSGCDFFLIHIFCKVCYLMKIGAKIFWKYSLGYFLLKFEKIFPHREYIVYGTYSVAMYAYECECV